MKFHLLRNCLIIFSIITLYIKPLRAQEFKIAQSDFNYNYSNTSIHKIIGDEPGAFYVIKFYSNNYYIEKLDSNLNLVHEEFISQNEGLKSFSFEAAVLFHNELYVFSSRQKLQETILYYQILDKESLIPSTERIEITTVKHIKGNWPEFHFTLSREKTKLLLNYRIKVSLSKVQFNEFYVFDKDLEVVWKKQDSFDYKGIGPRDNYYVVDEIGNVSILSLLKRESIFDVFREIKNVYLIHRYTHNGETFLEYPITFPDRYIRDLKVIADADGGLICAGLYSEILRSGIKGSFFFKIHPHDGRIYDNYSYEFEPQFLEQLIKAGEPTMSDNELMSYVLTDMVLRKNGHVVLIAEQFFNQSYNTYNNLIVIDYDNSGTVYWNKVIQKRQNFDTRAIDTNKLLPEQYREYLQETGHIDYTYENYCSYALMAAPDQNYIMIFYNDNIKNLSQNEKTLNFNHPKRSYICALTIDEYGNISKQSLLPWKKKAMYPTPVRYYDTLKNTIIIPAFRGRKYNYYKISVN